MHFKSFEIMTAWQYLLLQFWISNWLGYLAIRRHQGTLFARNQGDNIRESFSRYGQSKRERHSRKRRLLTRPGSGRARRICRSSNLPFNSSEDA